MINKNIKINFKKKNKFIKKIKNILNNLSIPFFISFISFILLIIIFSNNIYEKAKLKDNIFRIHVVANSNNIEDQIIKHKINQKILNYLNNLNELKSQNITSLEYSNILKEYSKDIINISNNVLKENNTKYSSKLQIGNINYDRKDNINYSMKKGNYPSMQILLGNAKGKNVWELIFPNKENIYKLRYLKNILPGIENIFND